MPGKRLPTMSATIQQPFAFQRDVSGFEGVQQNLAMAVGSDKDVIMGV